ncbi:LysM domain protein [Posidoniimonas corsicana]|uniref:LysM domain protein n=1 Tax=Posidoniimonas corsicana TaxID=1938618 RepID=A0A5C5URY9_9BACT|nr:LysM domain-containing protein [Posidoniimonas corsicana]TWT29241.1 LysM domain protein [Posidoniimonas corsicana]
MSTIRPLATIAILGCLGIFLAHQINQSPVEDDALTANWEEAPSYDPSAVEPPPAIDTPAPALNAAPPLGAVEPVAVAAPPAGGPSMPPLPATPPTAGMPAPPVAAAPVAPAAPSSPLAGLPPAAAPPVTAPVDDIPLPDDIPEANLGGLPVAPAAATSPLAGLPPAQPAPNTTQTPAADPYAQYEPAVPTQPIDVTPEGPGAEPDYESLGQIGGPAGSSYAEAIVQINEALARDELLRAHTMLSNWYNDPTLTPEQREDVASLLSQLAGTVVYSTDHRMEPPYTVKPGDTLETIAQQYGVPWRLLAKINGVPSATAIQAGQTLKVLHGPFQAFVDASNSELVLMIDGKYAGKFAVQLSGAAAADGHWTVAQKPDGQPTAYGATPDGKQLVLKDASGMSTLVIGSTGGSPMERGRVTVAAADLDELHDILSVGSEVIIRR